MAGEKTQAEKFAEAAKETGADEYTTAGDALMGRLARTPPEPKKPKAAAKKPTTKKPGQ